MTRELTTLAEAKAQAARLRADLAEQGKNIPRSKALEVVATEHGFRDWNGFHAAIADRQPWQPGARVEGQYLSREFQATVKSVEVREPGWFQLVLDLDEPVDVASSEAFSNLRKRIRGVVGPLGHCRERTSDGVPHLQLKV